MNFFQVANTMILVDLPGYGHGSRKEWLAMIRDYCLDRRTYAMFKTSFLSLYALPFLLAQAE